MKKYVTGILVISTLILSGCANLLKLEKPKVELSHVFARDTDFMGTTLVFVVDVENPNDRSIDVQEVNYKVFVADKELTTAKTTKPISVPAKKTAQVEIPLPLKFTHLLSNFGNILSAGEVSYRIEGDAKLTFFSIPFKEEGKVSLK